MGEIPRLPLCTMYIFVILSLKLKKNIVIAFVWKMLQKTAPNDILTQPE